MPCWNIKAQNNFFTDFFSTFNFVKSGTKWSTKHFWAKIPSFDLFCYLKSYPQKLRYLRQYWKIKNNPITMKNFKNMPEHFYIFSLLFAKIKTVSFYNITMQYDKIAKKSVKNHFELIFLLHILLFLKLSKIYSFECLQFETP